MKNKIYYLGIAACILTTCGCMFKIMHWAGASIILVVGLVTLAVLFLPLAVGSCYKGEVNKRMKTFYILVAVIMAFNFISALFKIMHWPGAGIMLLISIPLPFVVLLPVYLFSNPADKDINYRNLMAMMFFFAYFAAITAFLALGVSRSLIDGFLRSADNITEKTAVLAENTKWSGFRYEKDSVSDNHSLLATRQISVEAERLCNKIDEIEKKLVITASGNDPQAIRNDATADLQEIKQMDSRPYIEKQTITELKADINNFKVLLQKECAPNSPLYIYLDEIFNTGGGNVEGESWEIQFFTNTILASAIEKLHLMQFRVRLAANEVIANNH